MLLSAGAGGGRRGPEKLGAQITTRFYKNTHIFAETVNKQPQIALLHKKYRIYIFDVYYITFYNNSKQLNKED